MQDWQFTRNARLVPIDPALVPQWQEGEDFEHWLKRSGYEPWSMDRTGADLCMEPMVGSFNVFVARDPANRWRYLVSMESPGNDSEHIWLATFADWLGFLAQYGAAISTKALMAQTEYLTQIVSKLFCALHGHDATTFCRECDPQRHADFQKQRGGQQRNVSVSDAAA